MKELKGWKKACLWIAVALFVVGGIGVSGPGQKVLRGTAPAGETTREMNDRNFRAGLEPVLYCFLPGVLLVGIVTIGVSWTRYKDAQKG